MSCSSHGKGFYILSLITVLTLANTSAKGQSTQKDTAPITAHHSRGVLSLYPDLATGNINIKWENQPIGTALVVITDTADKEVLSTTLKLSTPDGRSQIDLSAFSQGEYTITINSETISFTGKLSVLP